MDYSQWATHEYGDILDYADKVDVIAHQVNCLGVMGGGLALQIANKWPLVLAKYKEAIYEWLKWSSRAKLLGHCLIVQVNSKCSVANLFGQHDVGGGVQTNYEALLQALNRLKEEMIISGMRKVAIPVNLGCGLAGGSWNIVQSLIEAAFADSGIQVILVEYRV